MLITRATVEQLSGLLACDPRAEQDTFAPAAFVWWLVQQAGLDVFVHARETDKRKCHLFHSWTESLQRKTDIQGVI